MLINILKCICLFIAIWWSLVNVGKVYLKNDVPTGNLLIQAIGITGFVTLQWLI